MTDLFGKKEYSGLRRSAFISPCGKYRYNLRRSWVLGGNGKEVCFVMLNPSTADGDVDDPTIRRCMNFTKQWGYSSLAVRNLFSLRATDPKELRKAENPIGPKGDLTVLLCRHADLVVAAWGSSVPFDRGELVRDKLLLLGVQLWCLGKTKKGSPRHPLYVPNNTQLVRYP